MMKAIVLFITSCLIIDHGPLTKAEWLQECVINEKDLIPEGTAYDPVSKTTFISSTYKRKVVAIDIDCKVSNFIEEGQDSIWSVIGMKVDADRRHLWLISSYAPDVLPTRLKVNAKPWRSKLFQYDLVSKKLLNVYSLQHENEDIFLNDLAILPDGGILLSESMRNRLYWLKPGTKNIDAFITLKNYHFPNGIALSKNGRNAFVGTTEGIIKITLATKKITLLTCESAINAGAIDGLVLNNDYLIGHQSNKLVRFYFNKGQTAITRQEMLDNIGLDSSTTGALDENGNYIYIANSQIRSGIDYKAKTIKPLDSLENVLIRRKRI